MLQREAYTGSDGVEREPSAFGPFIVKRYTRPLTDIGSRCMDFITLLDIAEAPSSGGPYFMKESLLNSVRVPLSRGSLRVVRQRELILGRHCELILGFQKFAGLFYFFAVCGFLRQDRPGRLASSAFRVCGSVLPSHCLRPQLEYCSCYDMCVI